MESKESALTHLQQVWENWENGTGHCEGCPNRDGSKQYYPSYGYGSLDADIALVAETPNSKPTRTTQRGDKNEGTSNSSFPEGRVGEKPSWLNEKHIPSSFLQDLSAGFGAESKHSLYLTNTKKCPDIEADSGDWMNPKAFQEHCIKYLKPELKSVDANVVVTFGGKVTKAVYELYGAERSISKLAHEISREPQPEEEHPTIIPSYHWSNLGRNVKHIDNVENNQDYWEFLAEKISSSMDG